MSKLQAVLFDFNGTLFFDSAFHELAWDEMSILLRGHPFDPQEMKEETHGKNNAQILDYLTDGKLSPQENEHYSKMKEAKYRAMCLAHPERFHLVKGVEDFFDDLVAHQIPFTIASASIKENIDFFVESFHLERWIDPSLIVYDDGSYPTKVEMFNEAARRLKVDIQNCLIFEDSISGLKFAHKAHAGKIIALDGTGDTTRFESFDFIEDVCEDFSSLCVEDLF